ncbi:acyl-CoA carboxylase epsilon subunit [Streptomyces sp. NPDC020141]|uniref:acyl-CoA carboxylase epsilon subunit n=1 Tax=Streptomyces sp. NPDC020141 TaxID=3365065 RepID=UPI0037AFD688
MNGARARDVRILRGAPTDEELAAVLVALRVLAAARARRPEAPGATGPQHGYRSTSWICRPPGRRGPGAWRRSGWN